MFKNTISEYSVNILLGKIYGLMEE